MQRAPISYVNGSANQPALSALFESLAEQFGIDVTEPKVVSAKYMLRAASRTVSRGSIVGYIAGAVIVAAIIAAAFEDN